MKALPCIVCGKELAEALPHESPTNQPANGLCFKSNGHYGSTVFDPMDDTHLEISVCDACLASRSRSKRPSSRTKRPFVYIVEPKAEPHTFDVKSWDDREEASR